MNITNLIFRIYYTICIILVMKSFLVPLDGSKNSQRGLKKSIELAKPENYTIVGLHVIYTPPGILLGNHKIKFKDNLVKNSKKYFGDAKKICEKSGINFVGKLIHGSDSGFDIVNFSKKGKYDMIIIGARGMNPVKQVLLGSTSNYVLSHSKIPVLVVK